ncbi:multicopper oxidase domain-containing protein [Streptomyces jumonjinensis]|nr:multicopper oxidase domain-containing protein [Streptomyces jumonjinensis]
MQAPPGRVTRIRAVFDRRGVHVWHCHMLDHEDHEMICTTMR